MNKQQKKQIFLIVGIIIGLIIIGKQANLFSLIPLPQDSLVASYPMDEIFASEIQLHNFDQDTWTSGGFDTQTRFVETSNKIEGSGSIGLLINQSKDTVASYGSLMTASFNRDLSDFSLGNVTYSVYIDDPSLLTDIIFQWGQTVAGSTQVNYSRVTVPSSLLVSGWNTITRDVSSFAVTGILDWNNIKEVRYNIEY